MKSTAQSMLDEGSIDVYEGEEIDVDYYDGETTDVKIDKNSIISIR